MHLTDQSASFLYLDSARTPMNAVGIYRLQGQLQQEAFVSQIRARLHHKPRYRQRLAPVPFNLAHPVWVDDKDFAVEQHVSTHSMDEASNALPFAIELGLAPLLRERPLWHMHLVHVGLHTTLLVMVVHHTLLEGVNIEDDAQLFLDITPNPPQPPQIPDWTPKPAASALQLATDAIQQNTLDFTVRTRQLQGFSDDNSELVRRATESVTRFISEPVYAAPWNRGFVHQGRRYTSRSCDHSKVRALRRELGCTENDIALTVVAEAAARYIRHHGDDVQNQHLRLMCPVRVRREDEGGVKSSRISAIFPLVDAEPKPALERLREVRWETASIKHSREAQALQLLTELVPPLPALPTQLGDNPLAKLFGTSGLDLPTFNPAAFLRQFMPDFGQVPGMSMNPLFNTNMAGFNFTCAFTPGSQTQQYVAGHEVIAKHILPALAGNLGFGVAVNSYHRTLTFNLIADPQLLGDLDYMGDRFDEVLEELLTASASRAA